MGVEPRPSRRTGSIVSIRPLRDRRARPRRSARRPRRCSSSPIDPPGVAHVVERRPERVAAVPPARARPHAVTSVRIDRLRGALRLADLAQHRGTRPGTPPGRRPRTRRARRRVGHGARWTEPSRHHDHTSSVTNGRCGANSRSSVSSATASDARAEPSQRHRASRRRAASPARGSRRRSPRRTAR